MAKGNIKIIKASAGSGKTYNLARTYIVNLIGIPTGKIITLTNNATGDQEEHEQFKLRKNINYHNHILAITFTNKATNEMKSRIVNQLHKLSLGENGKCDYLDDFKQIFIYDNFDEVIDTARQALIAILYDYGSLNVSTIDSFFQSILRNFARELDRDYNYDLQLDQKYAMSVAIHDFLLDLGGKNQRQKDIDNWVKEYIISKINKQQSWDFFGNTKDLQDFSEKVIFKEFFREHHEQIIEYLSDIGNGQHLSRIAQFRKSLLVQRNLVDQSLKDDTIEIKDFLKRCNIIPEDIDSRTSIYKLYSGQINDFTDKQIEKLEEYTLVEESLSSKLLKKAATGKVGTAENQGFNEILKKIVSDKNLLSFINSVIDNIWYLGLISKIDEKVEQYRKDTNSIMIADTNDLIGKVLKCGATFIYEHVGTQLYNYMIDEFQDTSRKQYSNFKPLLHESIDNGNGNLIIGDEKQAIYRFRNSDPSLLRDDIVKDFNQNPTSLKTNFRSYPAIVDFNNALFESVRNEYDNNKMYPSLVKSYSTVYQKKFKSKIPGFVNINFVKKEDKEKLLNFIPHYINSIRNRGYKMKDIVILVNTHDEGSSIIERIFAYNDSLGSRNHKNYINVISGESLLLINSSAVRLIISVLQFLDSTLYKFSEDDKVNEYENLLKKRVAEQKYHKILHDFQTKLQEKDNDNNIGATLLECFAKERNDSKDDNVQQKLEDFYEIAQEVMPDKQSQLSNMTNIVEKIIDKYILPKKQVKDEGKKDDTKSQDIYLLAFMSVVSDFSRQRNGGTIREFLNYWNTHCEKFAVKSPSDTDAVNIMTIHASKGLEFKCVLIPFANWKLNKDDKTFWISKKAWLSDNATSKAIADISNDDIIPPLIPVNRSKAESTHLFDNMIEYDKERSIIDNLNKLYVALTRPEEELHIFAESISEKTKPNIKDISTSNQLLQFFVPNLSCPDSKPTSKKISLTANDSEVISDTCDENNKNNNGLLFVESYQIGSPTTIKQRALINKKKDDGAEKVFMPSYRVAKRTLPVRISMHNNNAAFTGEGIRMHKILGQVNSIDDFDEAVTYGINYNLFKGNNYWTIERYNKLVEFIKNDKLLSQCFEKENIVYNERNIFHIFLDSDNNEQFNHRRPDRIVKRPSGEVIVLDYKFGAKRDSGTVTNDCTDVREYVELLKQTGLKAQGYLLYARYNQIVKV